MIAMSLLQRRVRVMWRAVRFGVIVLVIFFGLRLIGLTPERVLADTKSLVSGDQMERTKQRLRAEAAKIPAAGEGEQQKDELRDELQAERKRIMEEKANALEKYGGLAVKGDVESLKRQVEENARQAGGGQ
jgi:hypothetical protein